MCGETNRPTFGGTIAVLFPRDNNLSSERSLSSSPDSITSQSTSTSTSSLSSYSLFFRDTNDQRTKAVFQIDDPETYQTLKGLGNVDMRIEKYGDLSTSFPPTAPLHQFRLDLSQNKCLKPGFHQTEMEFELPERLDLGVSEKGVVGRQVTLREAEGAVLGVGIVGFN
ncbi:hypothetical protein N7509_006950 [Penicillium cosmopolitanum]|uniref:Uncharacterized protein n=1 Tax=Penicillium cosmopolitanum TaxID=1131564 RepID=A0A9X0B7U9_9EURO|nr:uncharacterized protein N7509_006950 [Penicillium cosmopolitanum]KAJ5391460.1 hypothetical protein N7509_006950 [Penicillium cosmopolitanum]